MKHITFYLDFISPYAYLAFERLPEALKGLSYQVDYRPVLFAGMLKHHGQLGPAEIPAKRDWTYRQVSWMGHQLGVPLRMPSVHPFNPLALLRLALACGSDGKSNRHACESIFRHVWQGGGDPNDPARWGALQAQVNPQRDIADDAVKAQLRSNTDQAIAHGAFGVPALLAGDRLFWGLDALPMLRAWLEGDAWFTSGVWESATQPVAGADRRA
jgi:2-hydroxychromene-2-carboxylate isomerase